MVFQGLRVAPKTGLKVFAPAPISGVFVLPITKAPRDSSRVTIGSELSGTKSARPGVPKVVRTPAPDHREGAAEGLAVVIEFESLAAAQAFYDSEAYGAARAVRETCAETDLVLAEGL